MCSRSFLSGEAAPGRALGTCGLVKGVAPNDAGLPSASLSSTAGSVEAWRKHGSWNVCASCSCATSVPTRHSYALVAWLSAASLQKLPEIRRSANLPSPTRNMDKSHDFVNGIASVLRSFVAGKAGVIVETRTREVLHVYPVLHD